VVAVVFDPAQQQPWLPACPRSLLRGKEEAPQNSVSCGAKKLTSRFGQRIILNTEEPMRSTSAVTATLRALIAAIPDDRLRELFVELALTAFACRSASVRSAEPPANGRRRGRPPGRTPVRRSRAARDAANAKRREKRRQAALARVAAGDTPKRRGRKPKTNGAEAHGNGATISAAALWEHARKLEPRQPWRAVVRELGVNEGAAQFAHRNLAMPADVSPVAAARFLTL
jgi:hypothetical protein